jgi:SAM-dependent methyltransferase
LAAEKNRPEILSVACGHLYEANLTGALKQRRVARWVALDADTDSLEEVQRWYGGYCVETVAGTVRQLLTKRLDLGQFDFIYSTGLFDYVQQPVAKRLTERLFDMLRPGGQLLIANFLSGIPGQGYMESFMDWYLIYRSHLQMLDLAMTIDQTRVKDIRLLAEDLQNILFLQVTRK